MDLAGVPRHSKGILIGIPMELVGIPRHSKSILVGIPRELIGIPRHSKGAPARLGPEPIPNLSRNYPEMRAL